MQIDRRNVLLGAVIAGNASCYPAIRELLYFVPPLLTAGLRLLAGGALLLALARIDGRPIAVRGFSNRIAIALLAFVGATWAYGAMFIGTGRAGAAIASVIGNSAPLLVVVPALLLLHEKVSTKTVIAAAAGLGGIALIALPSVTTKDFEQISGLVTALSGAVAIALASVLIKLLVASLDVLVVTGWQLLVGSVPLLVASAIFERGTPDAWNTGAMLVFAYLVVFGTAATTLWWNALCRRFEVARLSLYLLLVPIAAFALSAAIYHEHVTTIELIGVAVTIGAMFVSASSPRSSALGAAREQIPEA